MLDSIPLWTKIRARLRDGPLGPHLDSFVVALRHEDYRASTVRRYLLAADRLSPWMRREGKTAADLDEVAIERFVSSLGRYHSARRQAGRLPDVAIGGHKFADYLWQQGIAARRRSTGADSETERWLQRFDEHLGRVKGLATGTRRIYLRYARVFIDTKFGTGAVDGRGDGG